MGNIIQIKRGATVPDNKLAPYELGYNTDTKTLYIGGALEEADGNSIYGKAIPVQVLDADRAKTLTDALSIDLGGTGCTNANDAREALGAAAIDHTHHYLPITDTGNVIMEFSTDPNATYDPGVCESTITISYGRLPVNETKWGLTMVSANPGNGEAGWATGIRFQLAPKEPERARYASIEGYAATNWANQSGLRFVTKSKDDDTYEATFSQGVFKIQENEVVHQGNIRSEISDKIKISANFDSNTLTFNGNQIVHSGNHFTKIVENKTLNTGNTSFEQTINGTYSAYVFIACTHSSSAEDGSQDGYNSIVVPSSMLSSTFKKFVLGSAEDSKIFQVKLDNNKMTVENVGHINQGIAVDTFSIYGIK